MQFNKLHEIIPYVMGGKQKVLEMHPYNAITLAMPGRHAADTTPVGGDFVVMIDDEGMDWRSHQFTHTDLFKDLASKSLGPHLKHEAYGFMEQYLAIVSRGLDPEKIDTERFEKMPGLHPKTFFYAVQCLAVAEHRRYARYEKQYGGKYLPFRFGAGIVEGLWTATEAAEKQRRGRPGVEWLERDHGVPELTRELLNA